MPKVQPVAQRNLKKKKSLMEVRALNFSGRFSIQEIHKEKYKSVQKIIT